MNNAHFRYLDVLYAEDGEESVDSPYVPEVLKPQYNYKHFFNNFVLVGFAQVQ